LYKDVYGPEDNREMDTNQSGDVYPNNTVGPDALKDCSKTICSEEVQGGRLSEQLDRKIET
jgi:hypothetical protein